jgi:hypothetical protein
MQDLHSLVQLPKLLMEDSPEEATECKTGCINMAASFSGWKNWLAALRRR